MAAPRACPGGQAAAKYDPTLASIPRSGKGDRRPRTQSESRLLGSVPWPSGGAQTWPLLSASPSLDYSLLARGKLTACPGQPLLQLFSFPVTLFDFCFLPPTHCPSTRGPGATSAPAPFLGLQSVSSLPFCFSVKILLAFPSRLSQHDSDSTCPPPPSLCLV